MLSVNGPLGKIAWKHNIHVPIDSLIFPDHSPLSLSLLGVWLVVFQCLSSMETENQQWHQDRVFHSWHMNHSKCVVYKKTHFHGGCKNYHAYQDIVFLSENIRKNESMRY